MNHCQSQEKKQLRDQIGLQFLDKRWFPSIRNGAFDQWKNIISNNIANLHTCVSVDDLIDRLWNIRDSSGTVGIGEVTVHRTAEILANLWDLDMNTNCWSMAYSQMNSFCVMGSITRNALIEKVAAEDDRLSDMVLMDKIIFVNSLLSLKSLEVIR